MTVVIAVFVLVKEAVYTYSMLKIMTNLVSFGGHYELLSLNRSEEVCC